MKNHPGVISALESLKNKRSSHRAYILLIGLTGSGKSTTVSPVTIMFVNVLQVNVIVILICHFLKNMTDSHDILTCQFFTYIF